MISEITRLVRRLDGPKDSKSGSPLIAQQHPTSDNQTTLMLAEVMFTVLKPSHYTRRGSACPCGPVVSKVNLAVIPLSTYIFEADFRAENPVIIGLISMLTGTVDRRQGSHLNI